MNTLRNGNLMRYRLEQLEKQVEVLSEKMEKMLTNHLPHLQEDITGLRTALNIYTAINIGALILTLILSKLIK